MAAEVLFFRFRSRDALMSSTELTRSLFDEEKPKKKFPLFQMVVMMLDSFCNGLFTTIITPMVPFMISLTSQTYVADGKGELSFLTEWRVI